MQCVRIIIHGQHDHNNFILSIEIVIWVNGKAYSVKEDETITTPAHGNGKIDLFCCPFLIQIYLHQKSGKNLRIISHDHDLGNVLQ